MSKEDLKKKWGVGISDSKDETTKNPAANENNAKIQESEFYKVDFASPFLLNLRLVQRDGKLNSVPYPLQPIFGYEPDKGLSIEYQNRVALIEGRNLTEILDMLEMHKIKWIKESPSGKDDGREGVFVQNITITELS